MPSRVFVICAGLMLAAPVAHAWPTPVLEAPDGATAQHPDFPKPPALESAVQFWTRIFIEYDSSYVVLHDREDLGVVWEVVQLPADTEGRTDTAEARKFLEQRTDDLKHRLRRIELTGAAQNDDDAVLVALAGGIESGRFEGASTRVRGQKGIAQNFRAGIERARTWLPRLKAILAEEGVPIELRALPFIESGFNPKARSSAGAAGLWQLMPATARGLGLTVRRGNDERLDVLKATRAAAKMLRQNHKMLKNWPLAITGYNHGPYGVRRAVQQVGSDDLIVLIRRYEKRTWGFASKNFYAEFLAALRIVESVEREALAALETDVPAASAID